MFESKVKAIRSSPVGLGGLGEPGEPGPVGLSEPVGPGEPVGLAGAVGPWVTTERGVADPARVCS